MHVAKVHRLAVTLCTPLSILNLVPIFYKYLLFTKKKKKTNICIKKKKSDFYNRLVPSSSFNF